MPAKRRPNQPLDELRSERLRELRLRCRKLERELELAERQVAPITVVNDLLYHLSSRFQNALRFSLETELPPRLAGLEVPQIRALNREACDRLAVSLQGAVEDWLRDYRPAKTTDSAAIQTKSPRGRGKRRGPR